MFAVPRPGEGDGTGFAGGTELEILDAPLMAYAQPCRKKSSPISLNGGLRRREWERSATEQCVPRVCTPIFPLCSRSAQLHSARPKGRADLASKGFQPSILKSVGMFRGR